MKKSNISNIVTVKHVTFLLILKKKIKVQGQDIC